MVFPRNANSNWQFSVVLAYYNLPRPKQLELQAPAKTGLIYIGKQSCHFRLTRELLLELNDILLHLLTLALKRFQTNRFRQLGLVVLAQRLLFRNLALQLNFILINFCEPKNGSNRDHNKCAEQDFGYDWPQ